MRIEPETRRNEVLAFVRSGLEDISVSRPAARAGGWGIPVPDDPDQVVYVWWDALANYVTALGYGDAEDALDEWWLRSAERVHVVGKGIVRFHAVHWLALLTELRTADVAAVLTEPIRRVLVDPTTPPAVEAYLALHDWELDVQLHLVLPAAATVDEPSLAVRPVVDDAGWAEIHRLFGIDHLEEDARLGRPARPEPATAAAVAVRRSLAPGVTYLLAERSGEVAGCIAAWPGEGGIGMVEDVFVHPEHRRAGVATELLRHAVTHARDRGAGPVVIGAEVGDTPKHLYARFGFRPVAVARSYELRRARGTA